MAQKQLTNIRHWCLHYSSPVLLPHPPQHWHSHKTSPLQSPSPLAIAQSPMAPEQFTPRPDILMSAFWWTMVTIQIATSHGTSTATTGNMHPFLPQHHTITSTATGNNSSNTPATTLSTLSPSYLCPSAQILCHWCGTFLLYDLCQRATALHGNSKFCNGIEEVTLLGHKWLQLHLPAVPGLGSVGSAPHSWSSCYQLSQGSGQ